MGLSLAQVIGEFEHFDPVEEDFHSVKNFLKDLLDGKEYDASGLADAIIEQGSSIGTVQKIGGAGDAIGLISIINLQRYSDRQFVKDIAKFVKEKCPKDKKHQVAELFDSSSSTGLILRFFLSSDTVHLFIVAPFCPLSCCSERLFNVPDCMALPLYVALFDEIQWAIEDQVLFPLFGHTTETSHFSLQPTPELRDSFKFDNFVLLTKMVKATSAAMGQATPFNLTANGEGKQKKKKSVGKEGDGETVVYLKAEEEALVKVPTRHWHSQPFLLAQESHLHFDFPSAASSDVRGRWRRVSEIFPWARWE